MITPYILTAIGFLLIFLEFYLPGGIMAIAGVVSLLFALISFVSYSTPVTLFLFFIGQIVGGIIVVKLAMHAVKQTISLETDQEGFKASGFDAGLMGQQAEVFSDLRPGGNIIINGKKYPAVSSTGYTKKGETVEVTDITGKSLTVRKV